MSQQNQLAAMGGSPAGYFTPDHMETALRFADKFFKSGAFSSDVKNAEQAFVKIQAGAEMGMAPMEAMNSLIIINGHITIWGMALSRRLRLHGWKIEYPESTAEKAIARITKGEECFEYTATKSEVINGQAYKKAPVDKLKWHALSRLVRFYVPEVLGPVSYLAEEAEDFTPVVAVAAKPQVTLSDILGDIEAVENLEALAAVTAHISSLKNIFTDEEVKTLRAAVVAKRASFTPPAPEKEPEAAPSASEPVRDSQPVTPMEEDQFISEEELKAHAEAKKVTPSKK